MRPRMQVLDRGQIPFHIKADDNATNSNGERALVRSCYSRPNKGKTHAMPRSIKLLFAAAGIFAFASISSAQTQESGFIVTVKDQFESAVADADIAITKTGEPEKATVRRAQTNDRGIAQVGKLSAGVYKITVTANGFKEMTKTEVRLQNGETGRVEIVLEVAPIESNVEIGENDDATPESAGAAAVLNEDQIAKLPDDQAELERAIKRLGEAVTGEELPISVNGVQGGKIPPKASIQQVRVNQNVFSAQYDGPFGGGIEIFTRSNVDKFRGYVNFSFADSRLNSSDPFIGRRVPYQARNYFFNVSGPLFGKKANFFAYGGRSESDSSSVINAIVLDANFRPIDFKQSLATPNRSENLSMTVNADPTKKHKLYLNYNFGIGRSNNQNTGGFSLPSRANDSKYQSHYLQFSDTYLINANIVNQSRFLGAYFINESFGGSREPAINVLEAFYGGGSQQENSNKTLRFDVSNETTWQMGRYALGFGFRIRGEHFDQDSANNFGGTYTFSGRIAPVLDANNAPVMNGIGGFVTTQIDSLESYRRTLLFKSLGFTNQRIRELGGGANQLTLSGGERLINASQYDVGVYVQNSYKITETIAASFGVRYENQTNIGSNFDLAPRFGLIWAPKAKDKQKALYTLPRISVGYGLFYTRFSLSNTVNVRMASDAERLQYLVTETNVLDLYPLVPTAAQLQQFSLPRTQRFVDDGFRTPYQAQLNISANKRMPKGFSLNFSYARTRSVRQVFTQNINAPLAGTFDPQNPSTAVRPFGNVGNIYRLSSQAKSQNDRFSVNLGLPQSQKVFGSLRYSYVKTRNNNATGSGSSFDPYDFSREFSPGTADGVHSIGGYFFLTLPHKINLGTDLSINSGSRFNITTGRDTNGDGYYTERPAYAKDLNKPGLISTMYGILDPNPSPNDVLIPRNLGRGRSYMMFNSSLSKTFGFNEDVKNKKPPKQTLSFGIRVNNVFNIVNRGTPIGNMASPNFLRSLSSFSDGGITTINGMVQENFAGRSMSFNVGFGF